MDEVSKLKELIDKSNYIVCFTGAGVSTESGIPDFRSKDGLYNQKYKFPPEEILSLHFFKQNPEEFYRFYKDKLNSLDKEPNITHKYLAKLEKEGKLKAVITQNIDGLHEKAGSTNVLNLHGSIMNNYCTKCHKIYPSSYIFSFTNIPYCTCGGIVRPDIVLYEEPLNDEVWNASIKEIEKCDLLIVLGTSLSVYPASYLLNYFRKDNLVLINHSKTNYDSMASLVIHDSLGNVFTKLMGEK